PNGAGRSGPEVSHSAMGIDDGGLRESAPGRSLSAPGECVDSEVTASKVGLDRVAELDSCRPPEVRVVDVSPERRDFVGAAVPANGDGTEPDLVQRPW